MTESKRIGHQDCKWCQPSGASSDPPQWCRAWEGCPYDRAAPCGSRWDRHFLGRALYIAGMSKDPRTQVGAVIVGPDREPLTDGFNGLPRSIADTPERMNDKPLKLKLIVHAEMNAVLNAARIGTSLKGGTLYLAATDDTGLVWGGPPCTRCTVELLQVGLKEIVSYPLKPVASTWHADLQLAKSLIEEAGILYREVRVDGPK